MDEKTRIQSLADYFERLEERGQSYRDSFKEKGEQFGDYYADQLRRHNRELEVIEHTLRIAGILEDVKLELATRKENEVERVGSK